MIQEYNLPIKERVYPITDPVSKKVIYYTAEKNGNQIIFSEEKKITNYITKCETELKSRFALIKGHYDKEKNVLDTKLNAKALKFEQKPYVLALGDIEKQTNQKVSILSEKYDPSKVQYLVTVKVTQ
ncbi:MAG: hypothetical protein WCG98_08850 [bacterium]